MQGVSESEIVMKVTVDDETMEIKLPAKHSAALKAMAYVEGVSVFQKIVNAIVTELNADVVVNASVDDVVL